MTLAEVFAMEFKLTRGMGALPDLAEGIRCMVHDKNSKPKWSKANVFEISQGDVE